MTEFLLRTLGGIFAVLAFIAMVGALVLAVWAFAAIFAFSKILAAVVAVIAVGAFVGNCLDCDGVY